MGLQQSRRHLHGCASEASQGTRASALTPGAVRLPARVRRLDAPRAQLLCTTLAGRSYLPGKAPRKATLTAAGRRRPELPQGREHSDSGPGHSRGFEPMSACPSVSDWALMPSRPEEGRQPEGCQNSDSALNIGFDTFILSACVRLRTAHQVRRAASCSNLKTSGRGKISPFITSVRVFALHRPKPKVGQVDDRPRGWADG